MTYRAELLDRLEASTAELSWVVARFPLEWVQRRVGDEWSVHEALSHLRDVEVRGYAPRIETLAARDGAAWSDFNGRDWHSSHYDETEDLAAIVAEFGERRAASLAKLRGLDERQWAYRGTHEGSGEMGMEYLAERLYWHTLEHITQVVGNRQMFGVGA